MGQRVLTLFVALLVSVWTARHLGPEQFGLLSFAYNLAILFAALSPLGLTRILERDMVSKSAEMKSIISTAFILIILGATTAYIALAFVVELRGYDAVAKRLILILGVIAFLQVNTIFVSYFLSRVKAKPLAISNVIALSISNIVKILFILNDAPLAYFAFGFVLDWLLLLPILLLALRKSEVLPRIRYFSFTTARYLIGQSWPYIFTGLLITLYMRIDTVMIKEILGDNSAGQYSAAARLSEGVYFLPLTIIASLYPAIVNAKKNNSKIYEARLKNLYSLMFYLAVFIAFFTSFIAPYAVNILYGENYNKTADVLVIHIWAAVFVFLGVCSGRWLLTENLQVISIANTAIGAIINIILNLIFIPKYGINGAAWASIISYAVSGYLCFALWGNTRRNFILMTQSFFRLPNLSN